MVTRRGPQVWRLPHFVPAGRILNTEWLISQNTPDLACFEKRPLRARRCRSWKPISLRFNCRSNNDSYQLAASHFVCNWAYWPSLTSFVTRNSMSMCKCMSKKEYMILQLVYNCVCYFGTTSKPNIGIISSEHAQVFGFFTDRPDQAGKLNVQSFCQSDRSHTYIFMCHICICIFCIHCIIINKWIN